MGDARSGGDQRQVNVPALWVDGDHPHDHLVAGFYYVLDAFDAIAGE
jgi:hypothetical protein